ncbi:hypothetical protein Ddye_008043 [Dipteronia dyeriana]|uniref:Transposase-associated domain-containing protein n=1 Tax=Dipteronia dyeriana TaxID=168575 RepID=A0AAD9X8M7_9ROSI|nr:hypothetical protein Ddye_008043 [Dipteronia dyeriana]
MDKTWVHHSRLSSKYRDGARKFVNMAQIWSGNDDYIICPCTKCRNLRHEHIDIVYEHLIIIGMNPTYTTWVFHGESPSMDEHHDEHVDMLDTNRMFRDVYDYGDNDGGTSQNRKEEDFAQKQEDAEYPIYPGCTKYTRLSAVEVVLFNHKTANGLSDKSFSELLQILRDLLLENNNLPDSMYSTKKLLKAFDLGYEKIDACENDCCLFIGEKEHLDKCPKCQYSR